MKRRWIMLGLLISLGLNVGLGMRVMKMRSAGQGPEPRNERWGSGRAGSHGGGPEMRGPERRGPERRGQLAKDTPDSQRWKMIGERRLERLAQHLNLSAQQEEIFRQGLRQASPLLQAQREKVATARYQIQEIITAGKVNPQEVRQAIHQLGLQESQLDSLMTEIIMGEMEILDFEQRAQYLEILPVFRGMGPDRRMGRGQRGRQQP